MDDTQLYARNRANVVATNVILITISTIAVGLRLISRKVSNTRYWFDDLLISVALVGQYHHQESMELMANSLSVSVSMFALC